MPSVGNVLEAVMSRKKIQKQRLADKSLDIVAATMSAGDLLTEIREISKMTMAHRNKRRHEERYTKFKRPVG